MTSETARDEDPRREGDPHPSQPKLVAVPPALRSARPGERTGMTWWKVLIAAVLVGMCLYSLAGGPHTEVSGAGIAITAAALLIMPVLGGLKRRKAGEVRNQALAADAVQSATCAYLALVTLLSLVANAVFQIRWLDPVAGLLAIPILIIEGRRAWQGEHCC